ncbi:hypothetical protein [Clostridium phage A2]|nr:hypothetical protein [Clostridium phage A2]WAB24174.1 hypothetical protein [Clostridium phage C2]WAB24251.1 hypothetical protein [Clostridium phage H1]WAB24328.1 hypothetical protein [Clostridium phage D1]WAB24405.1 hypothetical protein [Clostridium phage E1]
MEENLVNLIFNYIDPQLLIIIVSCYCLGLFIKAKPYIPDWSIPLILLIFSISLSILYMAIQLELGFTAKTFLNGFIQGLICAAVASFGNQVWKQLMDKRKSDPPVNQ